MFYNSEIMSPNTHNYNKENPSVLRWIIDQQTIVNNDFEAECDVSSTCQQTQYT